MEISNITAIAEDLSHSFLKKGEIRQKICRIYTTGCLHRKGSDKQHNIAI